MNCFSIGFLIQGRCFLPVWWCWWLRQTRFLCQGSCGGYQIKIKIRINISNQFWWEVLYGECEPSLARNPTNQIRSNDGNPFECIEYKPKQYNLWILCIQTWILLPGKFFLRNLCPNHMYKEWYNKYDYLRSKWNTIRCKLEETLWFVRR